MDDQRHHPYENLQLNIAGHAHYEYSEVARSYVPMHWHGALELIYILSGELTVETEQRRWQLHAGSASASALTFSTPPSACPAIPPSCCESRPRNWGTSRRKRVRASSSGTRRRRIRR